MIVSGDMTWGMTVVGFLPEKGSHQKTMARASFPMITISGTEEQLNDTIFFDMSCSISGDVQQSDETAMLGIQVCFT